MTVYLDVLFLMQWLIHMLILITTGLLSGRSIHMGRLLIASALGSLYSVLFLFPQWKIIYSICFIIVFSVLLVSICFSFRHIKQWFRTLLCFYLSSFVMGGTVYATVLSTGVGIRLQAISVNGVLYMNIPWQMLVFSMLLCTMLAFILGKTIRKAYQKNYLYCDVYVNHEGRSVSTKALMDSGNFLEDPLTNAPVILLEYREAKKLLSKDFSCFLEQWHQNPKNEIDFSTKWKIRLIPYRSVGEEKGMLVGFIPDGVTIVFEKIKTTHRNIVVAFAAERLSTDGSFTAIIDANYVMERR